MFWNDRWFWENCTQVLVVSWIRRSKNPSGHHLVCWADETRRLWFSLACSLSYFGINGHFGFSRAWSELFFFFWRARQSFSCIHCMPMISNLKKIWWMKKTWIWCNILGFLYFSAAGNINRREMAVSLDHLLCNSCAQNSIMQNSIWRPVGCFPSSKYNALTMIFSREE